MNPGWLRWLHCYVGAAIAAFFFLLAFSGAVLIFKDEIRALQYPELAAAPAAAIPEKLASDLAALDQRFGSRLRMVRVPRPGLNAYQLYLHGAEALVDPGSLEVIEERPWHGSFIGILSELHFHLLAGQTGKNAVGVLGIMLALMALSGLFLWWPARRRFRWFPFRLRDLGRAAMIRLHRDSGALAAAFLVLFGLTGAGVVFNDATRALLNGLLDPGAAAAPAKVAAAAPNVSTGAPVGAPDAGILRAAQAALPAATLISWSPPGPDGAAHYFRLRMPAEPHPYGRSVVRVDGRSGQVLEARDATRASRGDRAANWLYPLHAARVGGPVYRAAALFAALSLAVISLSGLLAFLRRPPRRGRRP